MYNQDVKHSRFVNLFRQLFKALAWCGKSQIFHWSFTKHFKKEYECKYRYTYSSIFRHQKSP